MKKILLLLVCVSTITFTAPTKGTCDFICSFPGHYGIMKGKFIVE